VTYAPVRVAGGIRPDHPEVEMTTKQNLEQAIKDLETVFRYGDRQAIKSTVITLEKFARSAVELAEEETTRRPKIVALPGGRQSSAARS
jgi:hypothetical protein